ncbi:hypothetical protein C8K36_11344 [Rhodococcus sp. OK519]|uniref:DUF3592 domain-containing protein n=1 Tax=Rhodococcus sp. OK519 TaxID=2135729 RepID=UPI000D38BD5F|nr:hypothetical protein C8K36_11344 [Rhodococcus sp. OK519]
MSTIDPVAARRARANRPPSAVRIGTALILLFVGGAGLGYGWPTMFGGWVDPESFNPSVLAFVGVLAGLPVTISGFLVWASILLKARHFGLLYGFAAAWAGAGTGALVAGQEMGDAPLVSAVGYGCLLVATLCLAGGLVTARRRRVRGVRNQEARQTGTTATAVVSDRGYTAFRESDRILTTVTFTFTDNANIQRWVQRHMVIHAASPVVDGQSTRLWYDPEDPGNDKRIVVELADG